LADKQGASAKQVEEMECMVIELLLIPGGGGDMYCQALASIPFSGSPFVTETTTPGGAMTSQYY